MDGSAGNTMADYTANLRNGLFEPTTTRAIVGALPADGDGAVSTKSGPVGSVTPSAFVPAGNNARTIESWIKTTNFSAQAIASYGTANTDQAFTVGVDNARVIVDAFNDQITFPVAASYVNDNRWHHVVVTADGTSASAFFDGRNLGRKPFAASLATATGGLVFGQSVGGSQPFVGSLDEVAIYGIALSAARVEAHVLASGDAPGAPTTIKSTIAPTVPNAATVTWFAPTQGGAPITNYTITAYEAGVARIKQVVPSGTTTSTVFGLKGGTGYTFRVQASNMY